MSRRTQEQVQAEIEALKELLPQMPSYKSGINAALNVLENSLTHDEVFDSYEGGELFDDAHAALTWRDGHSGDLPSAQFREML